VAFGWDGVVRPPKRLIRKHAKSASALHPLSRAVKAWVLSAWKRP
jgi:hypothetical protein